MMFSNGAVTVCRISAVLAGVCVGPGVCPALGVDRPEELTAETGANGLLQDHETTPGADSSRDAVDNSTAIGNALGFWQARGNSTAEVRVVAEDGKSWVCGTGFMVNNKCLVTAAHNVDGQPANRTHLWFRYEDRAPPFTNHRSCPQNPDPECSGGEGQGAWPTIWPVQAVHIISPRDALDIAVIEAASVSINGQNRFPGEADLFGHLQIRNPDAVKDERVHHIHHVDGACKECAGDAEAVVTHVNDAICHDGHPGSRVQDWFEHGADGGPGSSGCPIFGDEGAVVGMTTAGGPNHSCGVKISSIVRAIKAYRCQQGDPQFCELEVFNPGAEYVVMDLGTLGGASSDAVAINKFGHVAGNAQIASTAYRAYRYGGCRLADLGAFPGGGQSGASGINEGGQVVGQASTATTSHAFVFTDANRNNQVDPGEMRDLGTLAGGLESEALDIGYAGTFIVGWSYDAASRVRACLWFGAPIDLGTLRPDNGGESAAGAISPDAALLVGWADTDAGERHAFAKGGGGPNQDLGTLEGDTRSMARDVNENHIVVGHSSKRVGNNEEKHAVRWRKVANQWQIHALGTLQQGNTGQSDACGINKKGRIVGWSETDGGAIHAFIHDSVNGMRDLNSLIPANSGWVLESAWGINERGQIVGYGTTNEQNRGFLLTPTGRAGGARQRQWIAGDLDWDADVDLVDFVTFASCYTGSDIPPLQECALADLDIDCDVDLIDFETFAANFTGSY